jgi:RNAse (barnase) inhibitor barstar
MMKYTDLKAALEASSTSAEAVIEVPAAMISDLETKLVARGFFVARVDRAKVFSKDTLMHALYQACQFPAYFGFNFDALEECLNDLSWLQAKGFALVFHDFALLEERAPDDAKTFLEIVREVSDARRNDGVAALKLILARA